MIGELFRQFGLLGLAAGCFWVASTNEGGTKTIWQVLGVALAVAWLGVLVSL